MSTPAARVANVINVTEIVDNSPFTPLHWRSFTLCMACLVMDGFDVQVLGYTAPSIVRDWGVPAATLGPVFAAANFGVLLGALAFSGLGLLAAARPRTIEGVSGVMNLVMVPMWVFSGIFFSTERFPAALQPFVQALPLTALNDSLRGVMLEGMGFVSLLPELALLAVWGTVSFLAALKVFRWQ